MAYFWTSSAWYHRLYLYLGYEQLLCKILYQYINKYDTTNIFHFLAIFAKDFYYFSPQKSNFGPLQLDIIAYIVSKAMNYNFAKFHAFIKKLTIDVIFHWL